MVHKTSPELAQAIAERNAQILQSAQAGRSMAQIATAFGISITTVYRTLRDARFRYYRPRNTVSDFDMQVNALHDSGMSLRNIARKLNISPYGVTYIVKVKIPKRRRERILEVAST